MEAARVLLAIKSVTVCDKLKNMLSENGLIVVDTAADSNECIRKVNMLCPDLLIVEYNIDPINGLEVSRLVLEQKFCGVILLSSINKENQLSDLNNEASFTCLTKPINKQMLLFTIHMMHKNRCRVTELENEINKLKENLDTRKEVERAKGVLMSKLGVSEEEAFKKIQKQSMDKGIPMKQIAKAIVLAYDM